MIDESERAMQRPTFIEDKIYAKWRGEEIVIWNRLTVKQHHDVTHGRIKHHHKVLVGDGSTGEEPEFVTPEMFDKLRFLEVYPDFRVIDPTDDEVTVL